MRDQLQEVQNYINYMREALLRDGSVYPDEEDSLITHVEAKKKVLKYLDLFAGLVAGAHLRLSLCENEPVFTDSEKDEMTSKVIEELKKDFDVLTPAIKDYYYCLGRHFRHAPSTEELAEKRIIVEQALVQLELLGREMDVTVGELLTEDETTH